ncbi:MAG: hypothetical protein WBA99_07895 [Nodosilinea sp.]
MSARNRLLVLFSLICLLDIALVILARDLWAIARILPTVAVMYFTVRGKRWAKWLLVGIFSLLVVVLVAMVLALGSKLSTVLVAGSVVLACLSSLTAFYMVVSPELNRYFADQRIADSPQP